MGCRRRGNGRRQREQRKKRVQLQSRRQQRRWPRRLRQRNRCAPPPLLRDQLCCVTHSSHCALSLLLLLRFPCSGCVSVVCCVQLQRMQAGGTPAGGTPTGETSGSGTHPHASVTAGTAAGTRSTSAVVPTANGEVKVDSKLQPPAVPATVRGLSIFPCRRSQPGRSVLPCRALRVAAPLPCRLSSATIRMHASAF